MDRIYLDWASTSPIDHEVLEELYRNQRDLYGNPSSLHYFGSEASSALEDARERLAKTLEVPSKRLIFTSGGSEANSIVFLSLMGRRHRGRVLVSAVEHPAVYEYISVLQDAGFDVREIPVDEGGLVRPREVETLLSPDTRLVSIMTVNNETGAIQPISRIGALLRRYEEREGADIHFHTDAVQAYGKIELSLKAMRVDSASFSSHKLSGPKGVGMLYLSREIPSIIVGGGQENGYRPGTENVPAIAAYARAAENRNRALRENHEAAEGRRDRLLECLRGIDGVRPIPFDTSAEGVDARAYSPYILSFTASPLPGEVAVRVLNDRGFAVSTGSACSSNKRKKRGRVLRALSLSDEEAFGAVRISTGWSTTDEEIERFCSALEEELPQLLKTVR
jgi:cysteine desulfurase